jgi:aminopeptidase
MIHAVKVQSGDNIWVEYKGAEAKALADVCAAQVRSAGGQPLLVDSSAATINSTVGPLSPEDLATLGQDRLATMKTMQGYIRVDDDADQAKITLPGSQMALYKKAMQPMVQQRVEKTRWLVVAAPTQQFATACGMTLADFERFYLDVCLLDYHAMSQAVKPLAKLMAGGKTVRIYSPAQETDLSFSIAGMPSVPCVGERNIPDGECFTAPVRESVNGTIKFGPSAYDGQRFAFIKLTFQNGHIDQAEAENPERTARLSEMLDTDPGARYVGEFSINFNPYVKHPTGSILFDEKIDGGIHMAMGYCAESTPNGNKSAVHWDMVHIQRPDYGGGELYIDDRLIRKDGRFVVPELELLNPEHLMKVSKQQ